MYTLSIPILSISIWSMLTKWEATVTIDKVKLTKWELTKWQLTIWEDSFHISIHAGCIQLAVHGSVKANQTETECSSLYTMH